MNISYRVTAYPLILFVFLGSTMEAQAQNDDENVSIATPKALSRQQGDKRPEGQFETELFGRQLTLGGEYEFNPERRQNLTLSDDDDAEDKLIRLEHKFEIEAFYDFGQNLYFFAESKIRYQSDSRNDRENETATAIERGESWAYYHVPKYGFGIQVGRQSFRDKREWWWDADLDAVRIRAERDAWSAEIAIAKELAGISAVDPIRPDEEDVTRWIGNVQWRWADRQALDLFWLSQHDRSPTPQIGELFSAELEDDIDADLDWLGLRARGTVKFDPIGRIYYWADWGTVSGSSQVIDFDDDAGGLRIVDEVDGFKVEGTAFDIGATWRWESDLFGETNITIGYAEGSGDTDLTDDFDQSFHQTGIQDNNGKFRGVSRFRYYGELFRPELSNIKIATLSIGREFGIESSVEIALHHYEQLNASTTLRDSRIRIRPLGADTELGQEIDIVVSLEEWVHWEVELVASMFRAGKAFDESSGVRSFLAAAKINYNF